MQVADIFERQKSSTLLATFNSLHAHLGIAPEMSIVEEDDEVLDVIFGDEASLFSIKDRKAY